MKIDLKNLRRIVAIQFALFLTFVTIYGLIVQTANRYLVIWSMQTVCYGLAAVVLHVIIRRRERRRLPRAFAWRVK